MKEPEIAQVNTGCIMSTVDDAMAGDRQGDDAEYTSHSGDDLWHRRTRQEPRFMDEARPGIPGAGGPGRMDSKVVNNIPLISMRPRVNGWEYSLLDAGCWRSADRPRQTGE